MLEIIKYPINIRASWHEYNGGMYFVTICTKDKEHYFGEIADEKMNLTDIGMFADEQFRNVTAHYHYAEIPVWVVMPNHIHAIVIINNEFGLNDEKYSKSCRVVARNDATNEKNEYMSSLSPKQNTLSVVIRGLKSAITKYANEHSIPFAWQPRFYDHIVRNSAEMNAIAEYIENNVVKWELDELVD